VTGYVPYKVIYRNLTVSYLCPQICEGRGVATSVVKAMGWPLVKGPNPLKNNEICNYDDF